ncbi:MAG: glycerophosphodiester phosphodiesterase [Planctomycetota bacterium]|nr:glycerophosphodiester phosphodiesterase [Planctomycetota bacterium]
MKFSTICLSLVLSSFATPVLAQMIVAHRGASFDAPENTLAAFRLAWEQNADGVEGDFYLTKDNQIVCIHDKDTLRTGGKKMIIADSTLEDLRSLEYGSWKDKKFRGEPIPTFAEVLKVIPTGKRFVIELKTGPEIVPFLKEQLDHFKPNSKDLLIIAFNQETVAACKETLPEVTAHWLTGYKQEKKNGSWTPTLNEVVAVLKKSKADGLGTQGNRDIVTESFVETLRTHGLREFHVWTVDLPEDASYFKTLGAMGITTNRPAFIRKHLAN